jgi:hypothetical protein
MFGAKGPSMNTSSLIFPIKLANTWLIFRSGISKEANKKMCLSSEKNVVKFFQIFWLKRLKRTRISYTDG